MLNYSFRITLALAVLACPGCSHEELFGTGPGATAQTSTPAGTQQGKVSIVYTLTHDSIAETDVQVSYSLNGSTVFTEATLKDGEGDGLAALTVTPDGESHVFVWDSGADLDGQRETDVVFRVSPKKGTSSITGSFKVHNSTFLAVTHVTSTGAGRLSLHRMNRVDGKVESRGIFDLKAEEPWDIIFYRGFFITANRGSNDVSVFKLDEENEGLIGVENSPFITGGIGPKYLAADDDLIFVSNVDGGTISLFELDPESGNLSLNSNGGATVSGCQSMVIRGGRLYIARSTLGDVVVLDIDQNELLINSFSPISAAGLVDPRAMEILGSYLYVANHGSSELFGFRFLGGGDLAQLASSPFSLSHGGIEEIKRGGSEYLFLAAGADERSLVLDIDAGGIASESTTSPLEVTGAVQGIVYATPFLISSTSAEESLDIREIGSDGSISEHEDSPLTIGLETRRLVSSD